ncbi:MAG: cob(I)yrinic acid a,c-diamide adenosyltransferase [Phycisphaera sp.]|nr:cob(I)yrinic acid a,c-diamide adenosyltransferase [Phycisphaera sp.]
MKLYTRQGDDGSTGLFGGQRVSKDALRVEAYGTVDELNSTLGLAAAACASDELSAIIDAIQPRLFDLGADLCTPADSPHADKIARIAERHVDELERMIDATCAPLPPMKQFVLPGGCELSARLHVARCVCRRAERIIVSLDHAEPVGPNVVAYVNRLSDLLFAMARRANQLAGVEDVPWKPE